MSTARNMIKEKINISVIAAVTGLSVDQIKNISSG